MTARVSHSLLDPLFGPRIKSLYRLLPIPHGFPPEGIIAVGHLLAIAGAVGFAFSLQAWWAGLLAMIGVAGNHVADCLDGTHARQTGQCRNGGELLDHFVDPLSFSYWMIGLAVSIDSMIFGFAAVIVIYATSVLTNIRSKMVGEFTLGRFGPTEFKSLLCLFGIACSIAIIGQVDLVIVQRGSEVFLYSLLIVGVTQLLVQIVASVYKVNREGGPVDQSEWITRKESSPVASNDSVNENEGNQV